MCAMGPTISGTDQRGRFATKTDRSFEGTIVKVLAVSPPMMLIRVYPMPCGDKTHDHSPYVTPTQWDYMGWSRPPARYVREYMYAADHGAPTRVPRPVPPPAGVPTREKFDLLLGDIYKNGANPDTVDVDDREDDDDEYQATD